MKNDAGKKRLIWFAGIWAMSTLAFAVTVYGLRMLFNL